MLGIVGDQRSAVADCGSCYPSITIRNRTALHALDSGPFPTYGFIMREHSVVSQVIHQYRNSAFSPLTLQGPAVQFCDCHEGKPQKTIFEKRSIPASQRVALEQVGDYGCINNDPAAAQASPVGGCLQAASASSNPSFNSSSGQPPSRSSKRRTGRTPCCRASSSKVASLLGEKRAFGEEMSSTLRLVTRKHLQARPIIVLGDQDVKRRCLLPYPPPTLRSAPPGTAAPPPPARARFPGRSPRDR